MKETGKTTEELIKDLVAQGVVGAIGDGISIQDMEYKIIYQNEKHKDFVGDHVGELCYKEYENQEQKCEGCPVAESFKDGKVHTTERIVAKEGGDLYFDITASPIKNSQGEIVAGIEVVRNISERRKIENELKKSEEKFRTIVTKSQAIIFMIDKEGRFLLSEGRMLSLLGLKPGEAVGMSAFEMYKDYPEIIKGIRAALIGETYLDTISVQGVEGIAHFSVFYSPQKTLKAILLD
jgi:PAS domain S-box-containing protein